MGIFKDRDSSMKNFTRGGQTLIHNFRMMQQIVERVTLACLVVFVFILGLGAYFYTLPYERYLAYQWVYAKFWVIVNSQFKQTIIDPNGNAVNVMSQQVIDSRLVHLAILDIKNKLFYIGIGSAVITLILFMVIYYWLNHRGKDQAETKKIRGDEIAELKVTNKLVKQAGQTSNLRIGSLFAPFAYETKHLLVHGTTGAGKSQLIYQLLDQIRANGNKAIIYDKGGNYIRHFYKEGDIILNPLDERTTSWLLWGECRDSTDYDSLAAALIPVPNSGQDPFWVNAARTIFAAAAFEMRNDKDKSVMKLLRYLLTANLDVLQQYLKGTEAETLVSEKAEKTAISIKAVLSTYLKSLKYVKDEGETFSIRQWVQDDNQKNWLFISSIADRHESLKPLISMWLDIAANSVMSLTEDYERRIFLVLDEVPTLQKLPYLTEAYAESRKFGGCFITGMQSYAQAKKIYGNNAAEEMLGLWNTRVFFRTSTSETAKWVATELGEEEVEETREGISYGESSMRSGISISRQQSKRQIVNYSEIMRLNDLDAYVRLPGKFPITKISIKYAPRKDVASGYIRRILDDKRIADIDEAIEKIDRLAKAQGVQVPPSYDVDEDGNEIRYRESHSVNPANTKRGRPKKNASNKKEQERDAEMDTSDYFFR